MRLSFLTLSPHDLVIWTDGCISFPFVKGGFGVLANCSLCRTEATLCFRQVHYVQVFPLKPAPFCTLFAGLGSTNKSAIYLLLLSDSRSVLTTLSSPPSFLLSQTLWRFGRSCLLFPPVLSDYNESPDTRFSRGTTRLMSWPDGARYLRPPQSLAVCLFLSLVSTLVFSRTGGVLSHQSVLTHRFSRFPPRNLCFLVIHAVSSLVFAAMDTDFF